MPACSGFVRQWRLSVFRHPCGVRTHRCAVRTRALPRLTPFFWCALMAPSVMSPRRSSREIAFSMSERRFGIEPDTVDTAFQDRRGDAFLAGDITHSSSPRMRIFSLLLPSLPGFLFCSGRLLFGFCREQISWQEPLPLPLPWALRLSLPSFQVPLLQAWTLGGGLYRLFLFSAFLPGIFCLGSALLCRGLFFVSFVSFFAFAVSFAGSAGFSS